MSLVHIKRFARAVLAVTWTLAVCVGLLAVTASPSSAATATFTQSGGVFGGGGGLRFSSSGPIDVPANQPQFSVGPASPYGSEIAVPYDAAVLDVNLSLVFSHVYPEDVDVLLVGPGGQQALVMSDVGGTNTVNGLQLVIDDEAPGPLPDTAALQSGAYRPTDYETPDTWSYPSPLSTGTTSLGAFDGTSAAGTWRLWVMDDFPSGVGEITSWSLTFALASTPYPSTLEVDGLPPVSDVNVKLHGFTSTYPDDMDMLLVGPGGQQATVMSDAGGFTDVSDLTLTFDDEAPGAPLDNDPLVSGSIRPVDFAPGSDSYGGGAPAPNGNTHLSAFDGISPNGQWRLYAVDDSLGDATTMTGWSLEFTFLDAQAPSGSVTIAGGTAETSTHAVTLTLDAADPAPSAGVTQMRLSNDGNTFSAYQPYAATTAWMLTPGDGAKTVFAQFRDADGNVSPVVSDSIVAVTADTVADTVGPRSVKTSPASGAKGVKTSARVKVKAGESLESSSVTVKTVLLKAKGSSHRVKATVAYRGSTRTIVLTPRSHLQHHTTYRVTVRGVRDLAGNMWDQKPGKTGAQALTYTFKTN